MALIDRINQLKETAGRLDQLLAQPLPMGPRSRDIAAGNCPDCHGHGKTFMGWVCMSCDGTGKYIPTVDDIDMSQIAVAKEQAD